MGNLSTSSLCGVKWLFEKEIIMMRERGYQCPWEMSVVMSGSCGRFPRLRPCENGTRICPLRKIIIFFFLYEMNKRVNIGYDNIGQDYDILLNS